MYLVQSKRVKAYRTNVKRHTLGAALAALRKGMGTRVHTPDGDVWTLGTGGVALVKRGGR